MVSNKLLLNFPRELSDQPIIYRLVKDFDLIFNILQANIQPGKDSLMILELSGTSEKYAEGMLYLIEKGIDFHLLDKKVQKLESRCIDCGACTGVCFTGALSMNDEMVLEVDRTECIGCMLCFRTCPHRAIEVVDSE